MKLIKKQKPKSREIYHKSQRTRHLNVLAEKLVLNF